MKNTPIIRPGIRPETLTKVGITYDDYPQPDSIRIPYFTIAGTSTLTPKANHSIFAGGAWIRNIKPQLRNITNARAPRFSLIIRRCRFRRRLRFH
jgi:hypothetical protein